jgi:ABC-type antimicrobial peptide transport system permease subunit
MLDIAVVGTFTILSMWVRSRAAELVLRRSVGATRLRITLHVVSRTMVVALGGVGLGLFLFAAIVRPSIADLFSDLPAWDPRVVNRLALLFVATALAGSLLPTLKALRKM